MPTRWYYRFPGNFHAFGPTTATYRTEHEARAAIRQIWELDRLPRGTELWRA
jgi:hypothetical protein